MNGLARTLWVLAWGDAMDEAGRGRELSGQDLNEIAPETPDAAYFQAYRVAGKIEQANGVGSLYVILAAAARAEIENCSEEAQDDFTNEHAERFGDCLAHMAMGTGVSWFDSHPKIVLTVNDGMTDCGGVSYELGCVAKAGFDD
jgi:hypothetical protein